MKKILYLILAIIVTTISCNKDNPSIDPLTNLPIQTLTTDTASTACQLISIQQINGNTVYNKLSYQRDASNNTLSLKYYDSVTNTIEYNYSFSYNNDSIQYNSNSRLIRDPKTKNIIKYSTVENVTSSLVENVYYTYAYDATNRLTQKQTFYNTSIKPDYITNYTYDGNNLSSCKLYLGDGKTLIMQTTFTYDVTVTIKPWIYLYADAFECYSFLDGFSFGNKPTNPVMKIDTQVFDSNTSVQIDEWITTFGSYVYSTDKYVLQVSAAGDLQQGLGFIIGTMRFYYQCKN